MQSAVNINSAASGGTRSVTETPHYRELLRADNERGAAAAARNNQTFIASLPQGLDIPDTPKATTACSKTGKLCLSPCFRHTTGGSSSQ